jgi:hypothetical protein
MKTSAKELFSTQSYQSAASSYCKVIVFSSTLAVLWNLFAASETSFLGLLVFWFIWSLFGTSLLIAAPFFIANVYVIAAMSRHTDYPTGTPSNLIGKLLNLSAYAIRLFGIVIAFFATNLLISSIFKTKLILDWMQISTVVIVAIIVVALVLYLRHAKAYYNRILKIGAVAAQTFVMTGDHDSLIAAKTVRAGIPKHRVRQLMMAINQIPTADETQEKEDQNKQRREIAINELHASKTGMTASSNFKRELRALKSNWLEAIVKCDVALADKAAIDAMVNSMSRMREAERNA